MNSGDRIRRHRRIDHHDFGHAQNTRDRRDIADEIEVEVVVERCVDGRRRRDQEQRVTVRCSPHDKFGGHIAARAGPVLDDKLLTEPLGQPLANEPCGNIVRAASGKPDHDVHRAGRIGFRPSQPRDCRQCDGGSGKIQKFATGKFHGIAPMQ